MKNVTEMRTALNELYANLNDSEYDIKRAKTMVAITNSMLKSGALELDYNKMTSKSDTIVSFFEQ